MSAQTNYGFATGHGVPGGIYDMYHYPVDSRFNEEANGKLLLGTGVVTGTIPGSNVARPTAESKAANFEGVVVNGFTQQHDLEGNISVMNNQTIGVMRSGRIWARLANEAEPKYGDALHLIVDGDDAGCFATTGGVEVPGRFIGAASNGVAPIELYGNIAGSAAVAASVEEGKAVSGSTDKTSE